MRVICWNCNGGFRNKYHALEKYDADILVIQECENPAKSSRTFESWAINYIWQGKSKNKGIGIFAKKHIKINELHWEGNFDLRINNKSKPVLSWNSGDLEMFLPVLINDKYPLLAVWTKRANSPNFGYIGQLWLYLQIHKHKLKNAKQIICGDLNSNSKWDTPDRWWNHSNVVDELEKIGMESLYHAKFGESQGEEGTPTFFLQRNLQKPYHIDYVFVNRDLLATSTIEIMQGKDWMAMSDHRPIVFETDD